MSVIIVPRFLFVPFRWRPSDCPASRFLIKHRYRCFDRADPNERRGSLDINVFTFDSFLSGVLMDRNIRSSLFSRPAVADLPLASPLIFRVHSSLPTHRRAQNLVLFFTPFLLTFLPCLMDHAIFHHSSTSSFFFFIKIYDALFILWLSSSVSWLKKFHLSYW